jgi:glycosyltransferase involved in cell wall biosynthesis
MNDKRILVLSPHGVAEDNGTTLRSKAVCDVFKQKYHVLPLSSATPYSANVLVLFFDFVGWMFHLLYLIPRQSADCIYCCADYFGFISSYILSKALGFATVFEAHGILSEENKAKNRPAILVRACSLIEKFVIGRADCVVALSSDIFEFYKRFNVNIELIPVFIDEKVYRKGCPTMPEIRTVGLIGPFDMPANKYYLQFLYEHVDAFDHRVRFKVIGKCGHKIISNRITYTGYISSRDRYIAELSSLDALLVPAKLRTLGPLTKILEAMASSLPVFVTPEGAYGLDYVEDGKNIFIASIAELVACVNQVIFDDARSNLIGANARTMIERRYSKTANSIRLIRIMDDLFCKS